MAAPDQLLLMSCIVEAGGNPLEVHFLELHRVCLGRLHGPKDKAVELTPLHLAAWMGFSPLVDIYFNRYRIDVIFQTPTSRWTPLYAAISSQPLSYDEEVLLDVVHFLVERHGADKTLKTNEGKTAADMALEDGHHLVYEYLTTGKRMTKAEKAKAAEESLLADLDADKAKEAKKKESNKKKKEKKL